MSKWLPFVILTILSWGTYIPTLHRGQMALGGSGIHAFLMVGVAYVLVAIAVPGLMIARAGSWDVYSPNGMALCILASVSGLACWVHSARWVSCSRWSTVGGPPSCRRSCLPVRRSSVRSWTPLSSVAMVYHPPENAPSPIFFLGILMAAAGAGLVLAYRPT